MDLYLTLSLESRTRDKIRNRDRTGLHVLASCGFIVWLIVRRLIRAPCLGLRSARWRRSGTEEVRGRDPDVCPGPRHDSGGWLQIKGCGVLGEEPHSC